jgi:hypothetical protein
MKSVFETASLNKHGLIQSFAPSSAEAVPVLMNVCTILCRDLECVDLYLHIFRDLIV